MELIHQGREKASQAKTWFFGRSLVVKIGIILLIILAGWILIPKLSGSKQQQTQYQTGTVERGTMIVSTSASGTISNANSGSISTQASGVVTKIYVTNGQQVKQGDPIADIELDQIAKQNYSQSLASYQGAKNNLDNANTTFFTLQADLFTQNKKFNDLATNSTYTNSDGSPNTTNRLLPEFIVAHDTWLASEAKYKTQQNVVLQAQNSLAAAWMSYQESSPTIYAPISGTVTGLALQEGSVLTNQTSSTGTITSQKIASIKTNAPPTIVISLTEVDVPKVKIGNKATVTLSAFPDKSYTGQVISIDTVGSVSSGVTTYPTVIKFDTEVPEIFSNMSAQASIITNLKDNVLLVPSTAVQTQNGQSFVRVMKNGQVSQVSVETGLTNDSQTEIVSGVTENESIVTSVITASTGTTASVTSPFSAFGARGIGGNAVRVGGGAQGR